MLEFVIAISVTVHGETKQKLKMAFRMFDIDKNEKIDKKEMEKIIDAIYDLVCLRHLLNFINSLNLR